MQYILTFVTYLRRFYRWIFRPTKVGVRALIHNAHGQILLVQHSYTNWFFLPGGQVESWESLLQALTNELSQELGIKHFVVEKLLGTYSNTYEYKRDFISVFVVTVTGELVLKDPEIKTHGFYAPDALPSSISPGTKRRVEEFLGDKKIDYTR